MHTRRGARVVFLLYCLIGATVERALQRALHCFPRGTIGRAREDVNCPEMARAIILARLSHRAEKILSALSVHPTSPRGT